MTSRVRKAANYAQARRRGQPRGGHVTTREDIRDLDAERAHWQATATRFGFCTGCGARVDEANGMLHDEGCIPGEPERCKKGQNS